MNSKNSLLQNKLIVYDSNCKVCTSLKDLLGFLAPYIKNQIVPFKNLSDGEAKKVDMAKFKNEMAVIDLEDKPTLYGPDGIGYIFSAKFSWIAFLLKSELLTKLFAFAYRTLAYNRYIIAVPKSNFYCDCFPDNVTRYRMSYIFITFIFSIMLTAIFGISLSGIFPAITASQAALEMILIASTGWVLQIIIASIVLKEKSLDYIGHLGSISVVGVLILLPWTIFHFTTGITSYILPAISVVGSSGCMLNLHFTRIKVLELSQGWTLSWFLLIVTTAILWIYIFYIN